MSDSKKQGYIKVYRKFFASAFWGEKREYSKAEAWLDLLNLGAYMPSSKLCRHLLSVCADEMGRVLKSFTSLDS